MNTNNTTGSLDNAFALEPRVYELSYLIMPTVNEGDLDTQREALVALITKFSGIVISEGHPQLIDLAYDMTKMIENKKHTYSQGYFGWVKFDVSPSDIEALTQAVEETPELIRFLLIKTVRENTLVSSDPIKSAKRRDNADTVTEPQVVPEVEVAVATETEEGEAEPTESTDATVSEADDLTKIEGVGPVIAKTLAEAGITTFTGLAEASAESVQEMIADVRGSHDAGTWAQQAALAAASNWDELKTLQEELNGGKTE